MEEFSCSSFLSQLYLSYLMLQVVPLPATAHASYHPQLLFSVPPSPWVLTWMSTAQVRPCRCCQPSWKYSSNRRSKTCQSFLPGQRIVCSGTLSAPQSASWLQYFYALVVSPNILVFPCFGFILNCCLHSLNFITSVFPLRVAGMNGTQ